MDLKAHKIKLGITNRYILFYVPKQSVQLPVNCSELWMLHRHYKATSYKERDCVYRSWKLLPGTVTLNSLSRVEVVPPT